MSVVDRRARILELVDVTQRGLELGPLHSPIIERPGSQVLYVDHTDTESLRRKYDGHDVGEIVDVDVVWGDRRLAEALGGQGPVRYVVASHVIEHVPDLVGWLDEVAEVLEPGGVLSLAIPDKRFCFDHRRTETPLGEVIAARLESRTRPSAGQVFDFWAGYEEIDAAAAWSGHVDSNGRLGQDELAMAKVGEARSSPAYVDVHCWVFTPASFLDVLGRLMDLDLVTRYEVAAFHPTEPGTLEFHVSLRRLADDLDEEGRRRQHAGLDAAQARLASHGIAGRYLLVSERERRLLAAKRRLAEVVRHGLRRARRPLR